jgi:predicted nucleic acid-binding protein
MLYLLDSSAVIDWLNGRKGAVDTLPDLVESGHTLALNAISVAEVYSGLGDDERAFADRLLEAVEYWEIDQASALQAGAFRYQFARHGITLAVADVLLAAHAIQLGATLVTGNIKHFPMPELKLLDLQD